MDRYLQFPNLILQHPMHLGLPILVEAFTNIEFAFEILYKAYFLIRRYGGIYGRATK